MKSGAYGCIGQADAQRSTHTACISTVSTCEFQGRVVLRLAHLCTGPGVDSSVQSRRGRPAECFRSQIRQHQTKQVPLSTL